MSLIKRSLCFLVCAGLLTTAANAGSVVLFDNLSASSGFADGVDTTTGLGPLADSFSTGGASVFLTDVKLLLELQVTGAGGGSMTVSLLSDNSTSPGSLLTTLATINDSDLIFGPPQVIDIPVASFALAANTRYWIQLATTTGSSTAIFWLGSLDTSGTGVASEFSSNSLLGVTANVNEGAYQMQVIGNSAIPEPSSVVLLGAGVAGIFLVSRFRRRRAA
jgi:hypothetical protein